MRLPLLSPQNNKIAAEMTPKPKHTHGGAGRNQGRKPGPNGPATARLSIKCRPAELAAWTLAAKAEKMSRSAWVKVQLSTPHGS